MTMYQLNPLYESINVSFSYHIRDPKDLSERHINQISTLQNQLVIKDKQNDSKLGLVDKSEPVWGPSTFKKFIFSNRISFQRLITAEANDIIWGVIHYQEYKENYQWNEYKGHQGTISKVVVDESLRGQGIGTKLMNITKNWVKKNRPVIQIFLGVHSQNISAQALYKNTGFVPVNQLMVCKL